jgi:hypothetical protein
MIVKDKQIKQIKQMYETDKTNKKPTTDTK